MSDDGVQACLAAAEGVAGTPVALLDDLTFSGRAVVLRISLPDGTTAIAKRPRREDAFARELEALQRLPALIRPALLGTAAGVLVMEDLGTGPSVADLLLGEDGVAAAGALRSWARALGTALRATLRSGAPDPPVDFEDGPGALEALVTDLGVKVPRGTARDIERVRHHLSARSPWLAFCPGDTCPDNNRVFSDGSVRLFDFEGAGWRHSATEAAYCTAPFPTCWCVAALPAGTTAIMEAEFLDALDPSRRDELRSVIGLGAVGWTLTTGAFFRRFVLDDRPVGPPDRAPMRGRQYVRLRLEAVVAQRDQIPDLAVLAQRLCDEIVRRWPDAAGLPTYPAFR